MTALHFTYQGKRERQEDSILVDTTHNIYVVCDGVGGTTGGKEASLFVTQYVQENLDKFKSISSEAQLESLLRSLHSELISRYKSTVVAKSYGTTIAILVINDNQAYLANIGDSKIYAIVGKSKWKSKDHSAVQELFDVGILNTEVEMLTHPYRNIITSSLSTEITPEDLLINTKHIFFGKSEPRFILASDGALEQWTSLTLLDHFSSSKEQLNKCWTLFKEMAAGSNDNSSAILIY